MPQVIDRLKPSLDLPPFRQAFAHPLVTPPFQGWENNPNLLL